MIRREIKYKYDNIWKDYGVEFRSLTIGAQQYFLSEVVRRCSLYVPKEIEESTADEDIQIQIKPLLEVNYYRTLVGDKFKFPLTLSLIGYESELVGVKAVIYNHFKIKETGIFFMVDPSQWEYSAEEKDAAPKRKDYQKDVLSDFTWLPEKLKRKGYKKIMSCLKIQNNDHGEPIIFYMSKDGQTLIENLENVFPNVKKIK